MSPDKYVVQRFSKKEITDLQQHCDQSVIKNSFMKILHSFLMYSFPDDLLHDLYKQNPLTYNNNIYCGISLIDYLWNESNSTPVTYLNTIVAYVESLLAEKGISLYSQFQLFIQRIYNNEHFLTQVHLPIFQYVYQNLEIKKILFDYVHHIPRTFFPDIKIDKHKIVQYKSGLSGLYSFSQNNGLIRNFYAVDIELVFVPFIMIAPLCLRSNPFSNYEIVSQEQDVDHRLLNLQEIKIENSLLYINNVKHGVRRKFGAFISDSYPDLYFNDNVDFEKEVTLITRDYFCPVRKKVVLKKNCIYGAPVSIIYVHEKCKNDNLYTKKIASESYDTSLWSMLVEKHQNLRKQFNNVTEIHFNKILQILSINNKPFVGGVQAKIFSTIIKLYLKQKRDLFEWRDLAYVDELICNPYSTGLSTRLNRLIESLKKESYGLQILKMNRGKYQLTFNNTFEYTESI